MTTNLPFKSPVATLDVGALSIPNNDNANRALEELASASQAGGVPLLKFDQNGQWHYGAEQTPLGTDEAVVLMATMQRGVIAWKGSQVAAEHMESVYSPTPTPVADWGPPPQGSEWAGQLSVQVSLEGGDVISIFKTSSSGGKERLAALGGAMGAARAKAPTICMAHVKLTGDNYLNNNYGKRIHKPIFEVINWLDAEGNVVDPENPPARQNSLM